MLLKFLKIAGLSFLILVGMLGFVFLLGNAIKKQARIDCLQWQKDALRLSAYYLTKEQKAQCDYFDVNIYAPIRK